MSDKNRKFYITTSIVYTNAPPHCGFALELLQADVLARHHRLLGEDVFFLTGTDEHGLKIARTAEEASKEPQEFCDEIAGKFKELKNVLNLTNDDFIRTTDQKRHWPTVRKIWRRLKENGDIYKKKYKGFYCVGCEAFLTEKELIGGKCPIHKKEPEIVEEENYFFRLSKYQERLKQILEENAIKVFPEAKKNEMLTFIKEGLEDVSCSRSREKLQWGIPVPGDDSQIIYVWLEALVNYLSALGYADDDKKFKKYWPADVHCIGKDIVRFHLLLWPAMLLSLGLDLPKAVLVHGFMTVEGEKMSKSLGNIVCPFELVKKYGVDPVRYFFLREFSPTEDGDFTYEKFEERYNADLAGGVGNLVARVLAMANKIFNFQFDSEAVILNPSLSLRINSVKDLAHYKTLRRMPQGDTFGVIFNKFSNPNFQTFLEEIKEKYKVSLDGFKFNEALGAIWVLIGFCDKYIDTEKPWEITNQKSKIKNQKVISDLLAALAEIAELLEPFLPATSEKILKQLKSDKNEPLFPRLNS